MDADRRLFQANPSTTICPNLNPLVFETIVIVASRKINCNEKGNFLVRGCFTEKETEFELYLLLGNNISLFGNRRIGFFSFGSIRTGLVAMGGVQCFCSICADGDVITKDASKGG